MDKDNFRYDVDVGPINHAYFYITATFYALKFTQKIDFNKLLHYLINVMGIVYKNLDILDMIPPIFYKQLFEIMDIIKVNKNRTLYERLEEFPKDMTEQEVYT